MPSKTAGYRAMLRQLLTMPPLHTAAPAQAEPARVVQVANAEDSIVAQTADGDIHIYQKKTVRHNLPRELGDSTEATGHEIQELIRELVRTEQLAGRPASYGGWQNHLKNVFKVESYRKLTVEQGKEAIKWLKQELGRMAPSLRRTNNPEWRKRMYNGFWAAARELGWSHDQVHDFANAELDRKKPIMSLKELGEQKLELLKKKDRYRAGRAR